MRHGCHWMRPALLAAVLTLSALVPAAARAASFPRAPDRHPWVVDGDVFALARSGDTLYLGGNFRYVGPRTNGLAKLDSTGAPDTSFPQVDDRYGWVQIVEPDGAGGWYVGGDFTKIGGLTRKNLVHVLADGSVDPAFAPEPDAGVSSLARVGGTLYVAGQFATIGGQARAGLAALDATSGALRSWAPQPDGQVLALEPSGSRLFVGGQFQTITGQARAGLAAFDVGTGTLTGWAPPMSAANVTALDSSASTLYVSGGFDAVGGTARSHLAAFDLASGGLVPGWAPVADGGVTKLTYAPVNDRLYLSGAWFTVQGNFGPLEAVDGTTGAAQGTPWSSGFTAVTLVGNTLYVSGTADVAWLDYRPLVRGFDLAAGGDEVFRAYMPQDDGQGTVYARTIAAQGGDVVVGGNFVSVGGAVREKLAAVDLLSDEPTAWNPGADGTVRALAVAGGNVLAGGDFTHAGGAARSRLAALDAVSGAATGWDPGVAGGSVRALAVDGGDVFLGGGFTSVGGQSRSGAAEVDLASGSVGAWAPDPGGGEVYALARAAGTTYLGGKFTTVGGQPHPKLAAVDPAGAPLADWSAQPSGPDPAVYSLLVDGSRLVVGGMFTGMNGEARLDVAAVDAGDGTLASWDAGLTEGISVNALAVSGSELYLGGSRTDGAWDSDEAIFVRVRESDGAQIQEMTHVDSVIYSLVPYQSSILFAGSFHWVDFRQNLVRSVASFSMPLENTSSPEIAGDVAPGETLTCSAGAWTGSPLSYSYAWRRDGTAIDGEAGSTYVMKAGDAGHALTCVVTAHGLGGAAAAESGPAGGPAPPANTVAPWISGTVAYQEQLTCEEGDWSVIPASFEYQWLRGGDPIEDADQATYRLGPSDALKEISCRVTAVSAGGRASAESAAVVPPGPPTLVSEPVMSGTPAPGETLSCTPGDWDSTTPLTYSYEWFVDSVSVGTGTDLTVLQEYEGAGIWCTVTARNSGGEHSAFASVTVPRPPPAATTAPRIVGTARPGQTLTCERGSWSYRRIAGTTTGRSTAIRAGCGRRTSSRWTATTATRTSSAP